MKVFSVAAALEDGVVTPDTEFADRQLVQGRPASRSRDVHSFPYLTVARDHQALVEHRRGEDRAAARRARSCTPATSSSASARRPASSCPASRSACCARRDVARRRARDDVVRLRPHGHAAADRRRARGDRQPRHLSRAAHRRRGRRRATARCIYRGDGEAAPRAVAEGRRRRCCAMLATRVRQGHSEGGTAKGDRRPRLQVRRQDRHRAQVRSGDHARTRPNRYLASFAGLAPIDHPRLAIVVQVDEPTGGDHYGGTVAGAGVRDDRERVAALPRRPRRRR